MPLGNIRATDEDHDGHKDQEDEYHKEQSTEDRHHEDERKDNRQQEQVHACYPRGESPSKHIGTIDQEHDGREPDGDQERWDDANESYQIGDEQKVEHVYHPKEEIMKGIESHNIDL